MEDIEILEEILEPFREQNRKGKKLILNITGIKYKHYEALENILKERQADKEKIKNSIPKAKVEEKIEEYKNMIKERPEDKAIIKIHINELQELLKDGGE